MYGNYFLNIDTPDKAYIFGLLFADGHFGKTNPSISLQEGDKDYLEAVKNAIGIQRPLKYVAPVQNRYSTKGQYKFSFVREVKNILTHTDVQKSIFPNIEDRYLRHFIRGLFDGDGCISIDSRYIDKYKDIESSAVPGTFYILFNYYDHAFFVSNYLSENCGINPSKIFTKIGNGNVEIYMIRWSGTKKLESIRSFLYKDANLFMPRKKIKFNIVRSGNRSNAGLLKSIKMSSVVNINAVCPACGISFIYKRYKPKIFCTKKCQLSNVHKNRRSRPAK